MAESQTRTAEYPDVEPEDFARFVEYAYRHEYTVPLWVKDEAYVEEPPPEPPSQPIPEAPPETQEWPESPSENESDFGSEGNMVESKAGEGNKTRIETSSLRVEFDRRNYLGSGRPKQALVAAFEPRQNAAPDQDFKPVFLGHARLYTFSCMRLVEPLRRLTLDKLHKTLLGFSLYESRVGDVMELARYAYSQGEVRQDGDTMDDLRQLVVEYMVLNVSIFGKHPSFILFLQEGGEFVADFWGLVYMERLRE